MDRDFALLSDEAGKGEEGFLLVGWVERERGEGARESPTLVKDGTMLFCLNTFARALFQS